jgi:hypothetical protein
MLYFYCMIKKLLVISVLTVLSFTPALNAQGTGAKSFTVPSLAGNKIEQLRAPWVGYVSDVEGKVAIKRHNRDATAVLMTFEAKNGDLINEKDVLEVNAKSSVKIELKGDTEISLGPNTVFRMYQHYVDQQEQGSLFNLLSGSARINIKGEKNKSSVKLYAPNVVISASKADLATKYDPQKKSAMVACLDGEISVVGMTDNKERKNYAQNLARDEYVDIRTSYEVEREVYVSTEPAKMTHSYKQQLIESFNADYREADPDEIASIGTSFLRIAPGFDYTKFREVRTKYYTFSIAYLPLIHTFSIFYIEPYFSVSFSDVSNMFMRAGGSLELYVHKGLYLGGGAGAFWMSNGGGVSLDTNMNFGYTFSDRRTGILDGFRLGYFISKTPLFHAYSVIFSVVLNFDSGRDD